MHPSVVSTDVPDVRTLIVVELTAAVLHNLR